MSSPPGKKQIEQDLAKLYELRRQAYGRGHRASRAQGRDDRGQERARGVR